MIEVAAFSWRYAMQRKASEHCGGRRTGQGVDPRCKRNRGLANLICDWTVASRYPQKPEGRPVARATL